MRTLNQSSIDTKNKNFNTPLWLYELEISDTETLYFAENIEDIVYQGKTYKAFPIKHNEIKHDTSGEVQAINVSIANVNYQIMQYIRNNDLRGKQVKIIQVFYENLDDNVPLCEEIYFIDSYSLNNQQAQFKLVGAFDTMNVLIPRRTISKDIFPFIPKSRLYWR